MTEQKNTEQKKTVSLHRNARKFRYGSLAILLTIAVIVIVILLNVVFGRLEQSRAWSIDVNALNATDFDPNTLEVLRLVDQDVYIYTVYQATSSSALRVQVDSILEKYHALNPHIHTGNIDPVGEPARILKLAGEKSLEEGAVIVTNADETRGPGLCHKRNHAPCPVPFRSRRDTARIMHAPEPVPDNPQL